MGVTTSVIAGAVGFGASKLLSPKPQAIQAPAPLPTPPAPEDSAVKAQDMAQKRRAAATQTVYSSPLGVTGQADVAKKVLLGQ